MLCALASGSPLLSDPASLAVRSFVLQLDEEWSSMIYGLSFGLKYRLNGVWH